jgi:DNA-binding SARP family transcriptional activator
MEFRILGPLEVVDEGRSLPLGGIRQRALLAALILRANEVVAADELLDEVWGDDPPASGIRLIQVYVSQLRKLLGDGVILTRPPGYVLEAPADALDLQRFERLVGEARGADPVNAAALLREGLTLWRGPPLADFTYDSFAQIEIARLQEARLAALEARIEADLALGRHADLVGELEAIVGEHPLREGPRAQLMLALYRSGRQAEALEAYQQARTALVEELGIEPSRSLRELHQAVLNQNSALDLPAEEQPEREAMAATVPPPPVAEPIARDVRKTVTAVFVGLAISSARGEGLDPEALRRVTSRAFGEIEAAVERHGGTIEAVAGDAVTAVFGLPIVREDDALRGVRAAFEARDALSGLAVELAAERALELDVRIGISTGEVVTGIDAGPQLRATGEPLTLSSRLGQSAKPGEILFAERTRRLVREAVIAEAANDAWRLLQVSDAVPGLAPRLASPMVGRERERRRLHDAFDQAVSDRSCQLFTVLGLAGVGKSRLVHEFLGDLAGQALVARGRCLPYGEGITFWPLLEAVKKAVGLEDIDSPEEGRAKLTRALEGEQGAELVAQQVTEMIGLTEADDGAEDGFTAVRALFQALARTQPLLLVFDDIHWGEATFLDLVEHVADWTRGTPILLVCLARPELLDMRPDWGGGKLNATSVLLEPLSDEQCGRLIENLVGLDEEVESRIAEAAEGNPLFVEEMLSMLIDDGLLVPENGRWTATHDLSAVPVPPTIQALLAARLDQLDPDERAVIERAAVEGKVFHEGAVAELASDALRPAVADTLGSLVRKELIRPERASLGERTYRFRHLLIRDAAYDSIPKEARAELHERFGRWLERAAGERATEYEEVVGYHLEQAHRYLVELGPVDDAAQAIAREAAERLGSAGRRAFTRSDAPAGANLISRAVALLPPDDPLRVELVPNVRVVQGLGGDMTWADRVLTQAVEAAATTGDRRLAAHALVQRGLLRLFTESEVTPEELIDAAERSIVVFEELRDELGLARAWRLKAQAHYLARRGGPCADASERAFEHVRLTGDRFEEREIVEWLIIALILGPAPAAEAARRCERLLAETADDPLLQAEILGALACLVAMQGRTGEARDLITRSRAITNDIEWIWLVFLWWSFVCSWRDDPIAAEHEVVRAALRGRPLCAGNEPGSSPQRRPRRCLGTQDGLGLRRHEPSVPRRTRSPTAVHYGSRL